MLNKYVRLSNSQKHNNKMKYKYEQYFEMSLADMDIGTYQPLHNLIIQTFSQYANKMKANINNQDIIYEQLKNRAKLKIVAWYNDYHKCSILELSGNNINNMNRIKSAKQNNTNINTIQKVYIQFCSSIVSFCSYCIMSFSQPNDGIAIMTPVYSSYNTIIQALKRKTIVSPLIYEQINSKVGRFMIDKQDLNRKLKLAKILLLCHPHNPSCRVWTKQQIKYIVQLCKQHNVTIVSDQILSDIYFTSQFYSLARQFNNYNKIIVANSVSKGFNYASLQAGYALLSNQQMYDKLHQTMCKNYGERVDMLGLSAICGCLTDQGKQWLNIVGSIILINYRKLIAFKDNLAPLLQINQLDSSYIVIINFKHYFDHTKQLSQLLVNHKIYLLNLSYNYVPNKQICLQMRVCIACQQPQFDRFLKQLTRVIQLSPHFNIKAKL